MYTMHFINCGLVRIHPLVNMKTLQQAIDASEVLASTHNITDFYVMNSNNEIVYDATLSHSQLEYA
jgi:hypothetical protein